MNKKGFTLIEMLAVILILALVTGIIVFTYRNVFKLAQDDYYQVLENNIILAGNEYFNDHQDELPNGENIQKVTLSSLIQGKYLEPVHDDSGNLCTTDGVYVHRENNKLKYEVCLRCSNYVSPFCDEI